MTTRRQLLAAAAATALAAPAAARAGSQDSGVLEFLVAYSDGLLFAYEVALNHSPLAASDRVTVGRLRDQARLEDASLRKTLARSGGTPSPAVPLGSKGGIQLGRSAALRFVVKREETLTNGWYAALQKLTDPALLADAVTSMPKGGRRLVELRHLAGLPLLPNAFETGSA